MASKIAVKKRKAFNSNYSLTNAEILMRKKPDCQKSNDRNLPAMILFSKMLLS